MRLAFEVYSKVTGILHIAGTVDLAATASRDATIKEVKRAAGWSHKSCAIYADSSVVEIHPRGEEFAATFKAPNWATHWSK